MPIILPLLYGDTYNKRIRTFHAMVHHKRFGEYPKIRDYMLFNMSLKRMFNKYGEIPVCASILMHFEQTGTKIQEEKFPFAWIEKKIPEYLAELKDKYGVDTDNSDELYEAVKSRSEYLQLDIKL